MALATAGSRLVWLGLTAVPKTDRDDLLETPVSAEGFFGSISSVAQCLQRQEEATLELSCHLPLVLPQRIKE